jgi:cell division protein FtsB
MPVCRTGRLPEGMDVKNPMMENTSENVKVDKPLLRRQLSIAKVGNAVRGRLPAFLKNKYFISFAAFCVIMLFLDKNDFFTQMSRLKELRELQQSKRYYTTQIAAERKESEALKTNPAAVEKLAREKYLMKRDNEELFLVPEKPESAKN